MKHPFAITMLLLTLILTSCAANVSVPYCEPYCSGELHDGGIYYVKMEYDTSSEDENVTAFIGGKEAPAYRSVNMLYYFDAESCEEAAVCPKPNCPHTDAEECFALGFSHDVPVIRVEDKIYWLELLQSYEDGKFYDETVIKRADKSGISLEKVGTVKDRSPYNTCLLYLDGKIRFIAEKIGYDPSGTNGDDRAYLYSFDPSAKKAREEIDLVKEILGGKRGKAGIIGVFNGEIIIEIYHFQEDINEKAVEINVSVDPKTLDITYLDGDVKSAGNEAMAISNGEDLKILTASGEEYISEADSATIVGDMAIFSDGEALNYKTGERFRRIAPGRIVAQTDDGYIIAVNITDSLGAIIHTVYKKLSAEEAFEGI